MGKERQGRRGGIALALGGGGARGLAHLGVLRALEEAELPVAAIAGTSMGGMIGALYAAGVPLDALEAEVRQLASATGLWKLLDLGIGRAGISVKGTKILDRLVELIGSDVSFADLRVPLALVTVDLDSGREVILRSGSVPAAVRATISIPGVFAPVLVDGMRLIDGGVLDNVPVAAAGDLGGHPVVAVDVLPALHDNRPGEEPVELPLRIGELPGFVNDLGQVMTILISEMTRLRLRDTPPAVLLRPQLSPSVTVLTGFDRLDELIAAGRATVAAAMPRLRQLGAAGSGAG